MSWGRTGRTRDRTEYFILNLENVWVCALMVCGVCLKPQEMMAHGRLMGGGEKRC